jgi:LysM repeat protein
MKRNVSWMLLVSVLTGWLGLAASVAAQNTAAISAAQEEAEDRYRRLAAQVGNLKEAQDLQQQQIAALEKSIRDLSERITRADNNSATQEKLGHLAEQIKKVDEARVAENKKIFETIDELHGILKKMAAAPPRTPPAPAPAPKPTQTTSGTDEAFVYEVQKGDTLGGIVQAYRQQNVKVTTKAIREANPKVNCDVLRVGQKLLIPKPRG